MSKTYEKEFKSITAEQYKKMVVIEEQIGVGSFGTVFRAIYKGKIVAIKKFHTKALKNEGSVLNQITTNKKVKHKNLVELYECYKIINKNSEDYVVIAQFCSKGDLRNNMTRIKKMSDKEKLQIFLQIVQGIELVHQNNIMHRDIKPQNILINENNMIKICDFGCSKTEDNVEQTGNVGTPLYADPRVAKGEYYTKKCDIFSLGLVMYYIFVGESLFERSKNIKQLKMNQQKFFNNYQQNIENIKCPEDVKSLLKHTLYEDETQRYTITGLKKAIEYLLDQKKESIFISSTGMSVKGINIKGVSSEVNQYIKKLLVLDKTIEKQKQIVQVQKEIYSFMDYCRTKIQRLKQVQKLPINDESKQFLTFLVLYYYVYVLTKFKKWAENSEKDPQKILNRLKNIPYQLLDQDIKQKVIAFTQSEIKKVSPVIDQVHKIIYLKYQVLQRQLGQRIGVMLKNFNNFSFSRIHEINDKQIKEEYRKYFQQRCQAKEVTSTKASSDLIRDFLDGFDS